MATNVFDHISVGKLGTMLFTPQVQYPTAPRHSRLRTAFAKWRERQIAHRELSALSDRDLADIGIARAEIASVIRKNRI